VFAPRIDLFGLMSPHGAYMGRCKGKVFVGVTF
jgi:hypothetical protein